MRISLALAAFAFAVVEGLTTGTQAQAQTRLATPVADRSARVVAGFGDAPPAGAPPGGQGLYFSAQSLTPIIASARGRVVFIGEEEDGATVVMWHSGRVETRYVFEGVINVAVSRGDTVPAGTALGWLDDGALLYFEMRVRNEATDPSALLQ